MANYTVSEPQYLNQHINSFGFKIERREINHDFSPNTVSVQDIAIATTQSQTNGVIFPLSPLNMTLYNNLLDKKKRPIW